jgi:hypothetical protein
MKAFDPRAGPGWCSATGRSNAPGEGRTRDELRQGRLLREVFEKYRIL